MLRSRNQRLATQPACNKLMFLCPKEKHSKWHIHRYSTLEPATEWLYADQVDEYIPRGSNQQSSYALKIIMQHANSTHRQPTLCNQ